MSTELIAILGVGVTIVGVILNGQRSQRADIKDLRKEMQKQGEKHSNEITEIKSEITEVKIEVAALKATVETYFRVRVDPPQQAAVAEPPKDYGAD